MSLDSSQAAAPEAVGAVAETGTKPRPPLSARFETAIGLLVAALIALAAPLTIAMPRFAKIERGAIWGGVVLAAMAGWGSVVDRLAFPGSRADLGLRLAWGAAALVAAGGVLCLVSLASTPVVLILVLGGLAWSLVGTVRARREVGARVIGWVRRWPLALLPVFLAFAVLATIHYLAGASGEFLNANDDQAAYMIFPQKILATGSLLDPFSMRRITAYGGHSFLQALTVVGAASPLQLALLDVGISLVIVLGLTLGGVRETTPRSRRALALLPVLFLLTLPNIRLNTASEMSGVVFFLAMFRTAASRRFKERPAAAGLVLAMLGAGACTLRQSFLVPVAVFMVALYLPAALAALRAPADERKRRLVEIGRTAGFLVLFLLPWALLSFRSNRTFLFPLVSGTYHPEYGGFTTHSAPLVRMKFLWFNICHCHPVTTLPFFLLGGLMIPARRTNGALRAVLWAAFIGFVTVVFSLPLSDRWNIARYYYGFSIAAIVATMLSAFASPWRARATGRVRMAAVVPALFVLAATVNQVQESHGILNGLYEQALNTIVQASAKPSRLDDGGAGYRKMQEKIPEGAPLLVMLDEPFWFDFRRNPINLIDLPGAASPAPGMPLDDDEHLVAYLRAQGYRYLAFVRATSSKSLYRRDTWTKQLNNSKEEIWRLSAPFYLHTFDRFDGLASSRLKLYDDGQMVALDLETMAPKS